MPMLPLLLLLAQLPAPHPLFDAEGAAPVQEIRLYFDAPDWYEQLRRNFEGKADPEYMPVRMVWGDIDMERTGVRFKGNSSYRTYPTNKKSFKLKTNEYVKGRRIQNIDTLNLNNAFKDPALVRERVYYDLAREAGLHGPRVSYAALYINDEYWGLYFLTEDVDGEFLENHLGKGEDGNLYKGDPAGTLQYRGPDPQPYKQSYEKENNESADDWSDLIRLTEILNNTPLQQLPERLEAVLDVESALTLMVIDNLTVNLDSYIGSGHNYYLYHRKSDDRFVLMPWDPNEAYGCFDMGIPLPELQRLPVFFSNRAPRPLAQRLWEVPEYRERYRTKLRELAEGAGHPDKLLARMMELRAAIEPWVDLETRSMFTADQFRQALTENIQTGTPGPPPVGQPPVPRFLIPGLEPFLRIRLDSILGQLQ